MSNKECDIVQDLLPLYYDNACSEESRRFVEKHLPGCNDCQKMYNELKESLIKLANVNFLSFEYKSIDNKTVQFYKIKNQQ